MNKMNSMFDYQDQVSGQFMEEKISYAKKKKIERNIQPLNNKGIRSYQFLKVENTFKIILNDVDNVNR